MRNVKRPDKKILNKQNKDMGKVYQKGRIAVGLTQEKSAEFFDVTPSYVSEIERGNTKGSIDFLIKACNCYNITPNDILASFIYFKIPTLDDKLFGYDSLTDENKDIIACMIRALNEKQNSSKK